MPTPFHPLRIVLLTGFGDSYIGAWIRRIHEMANVELRYVVHSPSPSWDSTSLSSNAKRHGIRAAVNYRLKTTAAMVGHLFSSAWERLWYVERVHGTLKETCQALRVPLYRPANSLELESGRLLTLAEYDLLVVCGTEAPASSIRTVPRLGTLTLAVAWPPSETGSGRRHEAADVSLHFAGSDSTNQGVLIKTAIPIFESDNWRSVFAKLREAACCLLPKAIEMIANKGGVEVQPTPATAVSSPTPALKPFLVRHRPPGWNTAILQRTVRRILRDTFYLLVLFLHELKNIGARLIGSGSLTVLYYHRVSDLCRDGMTIGIEAFEKQIRFLKRHYTVWTAEDLKNCLAQEGRIRGVRNVLITFDDGYEDNFLNALPILVKYGCTAIFFISTGLIGTEETFEHDRTLYPRFRFRNMTWTQVQEAMRSGITIGVHSHTHADLGRISHESAVNEIERSMACFARHLNRIPEWMSFPFGKVNNFTGELVTYVEQSTPLHGVFSANGHINAGAVDAYEIQRINIGDGDTGLTFVYKLSGGIRDLWRTIGKHDMPVRPSAQGARPSDPVSMRIPDRLHPRSARV